MGYALSMSAVKGLVVLVMLLVLSITAPITAASHKLILRVLAAAAIDQLDDKPIVLSILTPGLVTNPPDLESETIKTLWYSVSRAAGATMRITACMIGSAPAGTSLNVEAIRVEQGKGKRATGRISATCEDHDIITLIPSCAKGRIGCDGTALRYSLKVVDPTVVLSGENATMKVYLTLIDDG